MSSAGFARAPKAAMPRGRLSCPHPQAPRTKSLFPEMAGRRRGVEEGSYFCGNVSDRPKGGAGCSVKFAC